MTTPPPARTADALEDNVDQLRQLAQRVRLRTLLPLALTVCVVAVGGLIVSALFDHALGGIGLALGSWLLLLCVQPTEPRLIGVVFSVWLMSLLVLLIESLYVLASCNARDSDIWVNGPMGYAVAVLGTWLLFTAYSGLALVGGAVRSSYLPQRTSRLGRIVGAGLILYGPALIALAAGIVATRRDVPGLGGAMLGERVFIRARAVTCFAFGAELIVLGVLTLQPNEALASNGSGVVTATGIASLLGSQPTHELLESARKSFRAVRLDMLLERHLDTSVPSAECFAVSTSSSLGSVDAFLSHSWHDPPAEKWWLLQAWRAAFVRKHGREATVWIDRCSLDPNVKLSLLLPCLPIYLAGCDTLLALRGPTYLDRLWCVIELFVFYAMKASSDRILIYDFERVHPYCADGTLSGAPTVAQPLTIEAVLAASRASDASADTPALVPPSRRLSRARNARDSQGSRAEPSRSPVNTGMSVLSMMSVDDLESQVGETMPSFDVSGSASGPRTRAQTTPMRLALPVESGSLARNFRFRTMTTFGRQHAHGVEPSAFTAAAVLPRAKCTNPEDVAALLKVCCRHFASFDAWVHDLLVGRNEVDLAPPVLPPSSTRSSIASGSHSPPTQPRFRANSCSAVQAGEPPPAPAGSKGGNKSTLRRERTATWGGAVLPVDAQTPAVTHSRLNRAGRLRTERNQLAERWVEPVAEDIAVEDVAASDSEPGSPSKHVGVGPAIGASASLPEKLPVTSQRGSRGH